MSSPSTTAASPAPGDPKGSTIPSEILYDMFKNNFERTWQVKDLLEEKARGIMTVSSAVITLLFGFTTFAIALEMYVSNLFVVSSIAMSVIAIGICLRATGIKEFGDAFPKQLLNKDGTLNSSEIEKATALDDEDIRRLRASLYLASFVDNRKANDSKADLIWIANVFLFLSMFLVTLAVIYTLFPR
jgi:hypothetical protein